MSAFEAWLHQHAEMVGIDPEQTMPAKLINTAADATFLDPAMTGIPAIIGVLADVPAATMQFYFQEFAPHSAGDLQRHRHESVHYVTGGAGYSEIGPRTVRWQTGALIYTPPWVWHRHYNDLDEPVTMLLVENSPMLSAMGIAERESAGEISYADYQARLESDARSENHTEGHAEGHIEDLIDH